MQLSSRFTLALHILACLDYFQDEPDVKLTSSFLAESTGVNAVTIRNLLGQLKAAGLVEIQKGIGGARLAKAREAISFYDVFEAVEMLDQNKLFHFHEKPSPSCPVGKNIHGLLDESLDQIQKALERELKGISLADVLDSSSPLESQ